jgi:hypothetical protein
MNLIQGKIKPLKRITGCKPLENTLPFGSQLRKKH